MKYVCNKCGFIHEGDLPDGYFCPLCRADLFAFELIEKEEKIYNRVYVDPNNPSINRIEEKCINCGACAKICENIVNIHFDKNKCDGICINCGQCILTCPRGALTPKYNYQEIYDLINDPNKKVAIMTSPAVRVSLGDAFGLQAGEFVEGKMVSVLKSIGFDYVFDTTFGADLTSMEEAIELEERYKKFENLPMFSSCCPSWVKYCEIYLPNLIKNLSSCKSPIGMQATIIRKHYAKEEGIKNKQLVVVALTPCTAKKSEIIDTDCDYVMTTSELALLIREVGIDFTKATDTNFDSLKGSTSGTIFGVTGGVTLSVLRTLYHNLTGKDLQKNDLIIKDLKNYREYSININGKLIKTASVYNMKNVEALLARKNQYVFIEVMNCNNGCIGGGGQILMPMADMPNIINARNNSLIEKDKFSKIRYAYKNEFIKELYDEYVTDENREEIFHTKHHNLSNLLNKKNSTDK